MFIKDEAEIASTAGGNESGAVRFGKNMQLSIIFHESYQKPIHY